MAQGISNRESPDEEAIERKEHPPLDASGSSIDVTAQADEESIEGDRLIGKVDGAFGKEKG